MFEDIRIKMADKSKYKDIIIKSNNRVKKRLLDKYYNDMYITDVYEILLTMDSDIKREYLLNKLDVAKIIGSDLDKNGLELLMSLSEEERISLIKKVIDLVLLKVIFLCSYYLVLKIVII